MKITCTTAHLKDTILTAERFTGRHITLPILSHLLFTVKEKKILVTATNLETGIECAVVGKVQKTGVVTAPARYLSQILQTLPNETITVEARQHQLTLHTPSSDITILGLNPSDFPTIPVIKKEYSFSVPTQHLTETLHRVLPAAAATDFKPELAGVFVAAHPGSITFAATDSFRLAEKVISTSGGAADASGSEFIVPARTMHEVARTVPPEGEAEIHVGEHQVVVEWNDSRIISRLVDGTYPPYKNIIPKSYESTLVVDREELLEKVRLAAVFTSRLNDVTLQYSPIELEVATTNTEAGGTTSRVSARGRGASGSAVFNYRYLLDGVEAAGGEQVVLNLNGVAGAAMIQNPRDASFLYLLMPIRSA